MKIKEAAKIINKIAHDKGWWEGKRNRGEIIALCHSELSEALEEMREGKPAFYVKDKKPEGWAVEMIDTIIRIFDFLEEENIDIEKVLKEKIEYNKTRPYKHGKKF